MNKYRLPFKYRHPNAIRNTLLIIGILLAVYGLWWSCQSVRAGYRIYTQHKAMVTAANQRADRAMADVKMAMWMLEGKVPVKTEDGLQVAVIEWHNIEFD